MEVDPPTSHTVGDTPHGLPLRFSNLSIPDPGGRSGSDVLVDTVASSMLDLATLGPLRRVINAARRPTKGRTDRGKAKLLVDQVEGIVHQGELLLVLGPPTSNASVLVRGLSCCTELPLSDSTQLDYGLLPPSAARRPTLATLTERRPHNIRSSIVHMDDRDVHFAALSLRSTLLPVSHSKTPRVRQDGSTRQQWAQERMQSTVDELGLGHALDTPVGNPMVRGLSGGERKRASMAETLLTRAAVLLLDGPFNGLDSSTALGMLSYLQDWAKTGKRSIVITTPHCADSLFELFDKVLVLDSKGHQIFFGRTSEAQTYFEHLGLGFRRRVDLGEGVAEFLVGCNEGRGNDRELERAWQASTQRKALQHDFDTYPSTYPFSSCAEPFLAALRQEKSTFTPKSSHFTVSFGRQVVLLTKRQYALIKSELPAYVTKTTINLLLSVTVGTLFFRLPATTEHAFTRGSLLLLSIMFNAYLSLAELGKTIEGRDIVKRQGDYGFFSSSALAVARVLGDLPLIGVQCLLFGTITYLLAGLQPSFERFAIYICFVYATALNLSCLFRMFAAFSPNFESAIRFCGVALNILVMYAGYFIPTPSMRPWLKWIHYIVDPISYSYEAVLANEFHNLELACSPSMIVPSGPAYANVSSEYQTCTLPGSTPGSLIVSGDRYLALSYDFHYSRIWRNLGIIAVQALVFLVVGVIATNFLHFAPGGTKRVWMRSKKVMKKLRGNWYKRESIDGEREDETLLSAAQEEGLNSDDEELVGDDEQYGEGMAAQSVEMEGSTLSWSDVSLWVDTTLETRRLLDRITGYIKPGRTCALLGASGAGKSTLLNVLAGRRIGVVRGNICVDGVEPSSDYYRNAGYVEQFDLHDDRASVREALEFSALLRIDASVPRAEKLAYVDTVLDLLDLTHLQDAIIGTPAAGLNPEQRKRLTIAVEVVSRPSILFCDEPTTGLDTKSAFRVVKLLRRLSRTGLAVICTIHQPSAETFSVFDDVLLLQRGGKQVYFGPRTGAVPYFTSNSPTAQTHVNPADYLLDVTKTGVDVPDDDLSTVSDLDTLNEKWVSSNEYRQLKAEVSRLQSTINTKALSGRLSNGGQAPSLFQQCFLLTQRVSRNYFRDASFSYTKLFTSFVVPLVVGLSFFSIGKERTIVSLQNRMFSVFLLLFVPVVWMNAIIFKVHALRGLWEARERPSMIYGRTAFVTSLLVSEIPYSVVCATIYFVLWYFLVGFPLKLATIGFSFALIQIFFFFQSTWALWIVSLSPSLGVIGNLLPFFLVSMEAFNGSLMPYAQMPSYYRWLYHVSPFQHYVRSMLGTLLENVEIECAAFETVEFQTLPGQDCASYLASYLQSNAGHLINPTSTSTCTFCPLSSGVEFLSTLNIDPSTRYSSLYILLGYTFSNLLFAYLFVFFPPSMPPFLRQLWRTITGSQGDDGAMGGGRKTAEQEAEEAWKLEGQNHSHQLGENVQVHDPFS
ncbi:uncharacterized protein JCM6883_006876 [Sporobolomyces salmoneus]|uniref:uncharacterized protein n=1 Tax=Sporobolomyces salmoneus TaxID=183962 RepID=UPI0031754239